MEHLENPGISDAELLWRDFLENRTTPNKNALILHYLHLVSHIARRMMPSYHQYCSLDDLIGYGVLGLIDAIDKFDVGRNVKFEAYAVKRIRGEMLDSIRRQDWAPSSLRAKIKLIGNTYDEMENEMRGQISDSAVASRLGMGVEQVRKIQDKAHQFNLLSFEGLADATSSDSYSLLDATRSGPDDEPDKQMEQSELRDALATQIDKLPPNERRVIELYYFEELMLKDIARILRLSESRISQIHSKALGRLRTTLPYVL